MDIQLKALLDAREVPDAEVLKAKTGVVDEFASGIVRFVLKMAVNERTIGAASVETEVTRDKVQVASKAVGGANIGTAER